MPTYISEHPEWSRSVSVPSTVSCRINTSGSVCKQGEVDTQTDNDSTRDWMA